MTTGSCSRHALDEEAPRGEEVLAVRRDSLREPEQVLQPRLDERSLFGILDDLGYRFARSFVDRRLRRPRPP